MTRNLAGRFVSRARVNGFLVGLMLLVVCACDARWYPLVELVAVVTHLVPVPAGTVALLLDLQGSYRLFLLLRPGCRRAGAVPNKLLQPKDPLKWTARRRARLDSRSYRTRTVRQVATVARN